MTRLFLCISFIICGSVTSFVLRTNIPSSNCPVLPCEGLSSSCRTLVSSSRCRNKHFLLLSEPNPSTEEQSEKSGGSGEKKKKLSEEDKNFILTELGVCLSQLRKSGVLTRQLNDETVEYTLQYIRPLIGAPIPFTTEQFMTGEPIKGKWRMLFSTESRWNMLPSGGTVFMEVSSVAEGAKLDLVVKVQDSWLPETRRKSLYETTPSGYLRLTWDTGPFKFLLGQAEDNIITGYLDSNIWIEVVYEKDPQTRQEEMKYTVYQRELE